MGKYSLTTYIWYVMTGAVIAGLCLFLFTPNSASKAADESPPPAAVHFNFDSFKGKKLLLLVFSVKDPRVDEAVSLMNELHDIRKEYNFETAGLCLDTDSPQKLRQYTSNNKISFPVYPGHDKNLSQKLRMRGDLGLYIFDDTGNRIAQTWAVYIPYHGNLGQTWRSYAARYLLFPDTPPDEPVLGSYPKLPDFEAKTLTGSMLRISDVYSKKPTVIVLFSARCGHCKHELEFLQHLMTDSELQDRFSLVAISISGVQETVSMVNQRNYPFPVIPDIGRRIVSRFPSFIGLVPVSYVVDTQGRVVALHKGFSDYMRNLYVMELKKLVGLPNPPLLSETGFSGEQYCAVCHEKQHIQWSLTQHSRAFLSLVRKGRENDPACIACHVTGYDMQGGYSLSNKSLQKHLKHVQCEACHGPGHESCTAFGTNKDNHRNIDWKKRCLSCHTEKESLQFVFSKDFQKIVHSSLPDIESMSRTERLQLRQNLTGQKNIFKTPSRYVGADACKKCHEEQYRHWKTTVHATVHTTDQAQAAPEKKKYRYNTGVGHPGGYPSKGMRGVQCESCHGPAQRHLKNPSALSQDYIVSLSQECQSCVVEQICRRCHTPADDPDFIFSEAVKQIRHTGKASVSKKASPAH